MSRAEYMRQWRRDRGVIPRAAYLELVRGDQVHGGLSRYNAGCRCELCRQRGDEYRASRRGAA
jgi:hypothetical protein